jgi:hypothetical protein
MRPIHFHTVCSAVVISTALHFAIASSSPGPLLIGVLTLVVSFVTHARREILSPPGGGHDDARDD